MTHELREITAEAPASGAQELIDELQSQLDRGIISSVAVAIVYRTGETQAAFSDLRSTATMLGAVERLRHRLVMRLEE